MDLKKIISTILTISLLTNSLGGKCVFDNNKNEFKIVKNIDYDNSNEIEETFSEFDFNLYLKNIDAIDIGYNYEEEYIDANNLNRYIDGTNNSNSFFHNVEDVDKYLFEICKKIKTNSYEFVIENDEYFLDFNSKNGFVEKTFKSIDLFQIFEESMLDIILNASNDVSEDLCNLKDLKIVYTSYYNDFYSYYDNNEKLLMLNYNGIFEKAMNNDLDMKYEDKVKYELSLTLKRAIEYVRLYLCEHRNDELANLGVVIKEASTESMLYNLNIDSESANKNNFQYLKSNYRSKESLILLLGLCNSDINDYYNSLLDNNYDKLFEFCNLDNYEDKMKLCKILKTMDVADISISNNKLIGQDYKIDILKLALKNIIKYIEANKNIDIKEVVNLYEFTLNCAVDYSNLDDYSDTFIKSVINIDSYFQKFICDFYKIDKDELDILIDNNCVNEVSEIVSYGCLIFKEKEEETKELIQKYPLLIPITYSNYVIDSEFEKLIERRDKKL